MRGLNGLLGLEDSRCLAIALSLTCVLPQERLLLILQGFSQGSQHYTPTSQRPGHVEVTTLDLETCKEPDRARRSMSTQRRWKERGKESPQCERGLTFVLSFILLPPLRREQDEAYARAVAVGDVCWRRFS